MTPAEASAHADGMLMFLKKFDPAEAMWVLTHLNAKAIFATTAADKGFEQSMVLMFTEVGRLIGEEMRRGMQ